MKFVHLFLLALLPALAACAGPASTATPTASEPTYFVMRHLHTPQGERDPDLLAEGQAAAQRPVQMLERERPAIIYVSTFKRTQQTAAAVAARYGLTPIVYDPADTAGLIARVRAGPFPVLIVGHSNTVPDIVEQLGGPRPAPLSHPDFGDLWRIGADGTTVKQRVP